MGHLFEPKDLKVEEAVASRRPRVRGRKAAGDGKKEKPED
jgi:hypothetical protein